LAVALIDGRVGPEQLQTERIRRPDVHELLTGIHIRPDAALTARYPHATPVRVKVTLRDGRQVSREQEDFEGAPSRPFTWERTVEKFHWLAQQYAENGVRAAIIAAVNDLDDTPVALTGLLAKVGREPRPPKRRTTFPADGGGNERQRKSGCPQSPVVRDFDSFVAAEGRSCDVWPGPLPRGIHA
jgi:2-methylcitrate dehydratase